MKILVIEDNDDLLNLIALRLSLECDCVVEAIASKFEELLAPDPWEGVSAALIDYNLPRVSGLTITKYIKSIRPEVRVVILSAVSPYVLPDELFEVADAVLTKPEDFSRVAEVLGC